MTKIPPPTPHLGYSKTCYPLYSFAVQVKKKKDDSIKPSSVRSSWEVGRIILKRADSTLVWTMFNREFPCEPWECHYSYKTDKPTKKIVQSDFKWVFSWSFSEAQIRWNKQGLSANTTKNNLINNRDKIHICSWRGRSLSQCFFPRLKKSQATQARWRKDCVMSMNGLWRKHLCGIVHCLHFLSEPCKWGSSIWIFLAIVINKSIMAAWCAVLQVISKNKAKRMNKEENKPNQAFNIDCWAFLLCNKMGTSTSFRIAFPQNYNCFVLLNCWNLMV